MERYIRDPSNANDTVAKLERQASCTSFFLRRFHCSNERQTRYRSACCASIQLRTSMAPQSEETEVTMAKEAR